MSDTRPMLDAASQPFLQASFDPAEYLNNTLPSLAVAGHSKDQAGRIALAELVPRTQSLITQLSAQTSRLSDTLTKLTDEIIRGGSRLAYEVEILRGETGGLSESLNEALRDDIAKFLPSQVPDASSAEPESIKQLRTLTLIRSRLDAVIKVFGEAMQWPIPPSEVSSSLISVSAPNVTQEEQRSREKRGKDATTKLQNELQDILTSAISTASGIALANRRIDELKGLSAVWQGTAEDKVRARIIENLSKLVDDEQKRLAKKTDGRRQTASPAAGVDLRYGDGPRNDAGYGFMNNLKSFKGNMYLE